MLSLEKINLFFAGESEFMFYWKSEFILFAESMLFTGESEFIFFLEKVGLCSYYFFVDFSVELFQLRVLRHEW